MSTSKWIFDLPGEFVASRRRLERYPDGRGDWKPHAKSRTLASLATHVARLPEHGVSILTTDSLDLAAARAKADAR
ncbi:MAG: hypothetical protein ACRENQ_04435 [Gemmatimonadaceae bacterium]